MLLKATACAERVSQSYCGNENALGPEHLATAEVATAGFLSLTHSALSCGLLLGFSWRTELYKSGVGLSLKMWMFNDVVTWEGGHGVCKWFHSKA